MIRPLNLNKFLLCCVWRVSKLERPVSHGALLGSWGCCQEVFLVCQDPLPGHNSPKGSCRIDGCWGQYIY